MGIIKSQYSTAIGIMKGQRIAQAMRPFRRNFRAPGLDLNPETAFFVNEMNRSIQLKKKRHARVFVSLAHMPYINTPC